MSGDPPFLERASYRRRRLEDSARMLPVLAAILFALPVLWAGDGASAAKSGLYLFAVWGAMIAVSGLVARALRRTAPGRDDDPAG